MGTLEEIAGHATQQLFTERLEKARIQRFAWKRCGRASTSGGLLASVLFHFGGSRGQQHRFQQIENSEIF
jgi:hypothetical protein